jgi:hypothetical protein
LHIPEEHTFLLDLSDEQLALKTCLRRDGHALAILQERQHQDRAYLKVSDPYGQSVQLDVAEVRQRVHRRRKVLTALNQLFTTGSIHWWSRDWLIG